MIISDSTQPILTEIERIMVEEKKERRLPYSKPEIYYAYWVQRRNILEIIHSLQHKTLRDARNL